MDTNWVSLSSRRALWLNRVPTRFNPFLCELLSLIVLSDLLNRRYHIPVACKTLLQARLSQFFQDFSIKSCRNEAFEFLSRFWSWINLLLNVPLSQILYFVFQWLDWKCSFMNVKQDCSHGNIDYALLIPDPWLLKNVFIKLEDVKDLLQSC